MELDRVGAATSCRLAFLWRRSGSSCRVGGAECRCPRARCAVHSPAIFNSLETRVTVYVHSITITHIVRCMQFASGSKIWFELAERYSVRANFQAHRIFFFSHQSTLSMHQGPNRCSEKNGFESKKFFDKRKRKLDYISIFVPCSFF